MYYKFTLSSNNNALRKTIFKKEIYDIYLESTGGHNKYNNKSAIREGKKRKGGKGGKEGRKDKGGMDERKEFLLMDSLNVSFLLYNKRL